MLQRCAGRRGRTCTDTPGLDDARAFLGELERSTQLCGDRLMDKIMTGPNQGRGTWVHPDLAVDIARWCSPKFAVAIAQLVRRYVQGQVTTEESQAAARTVGNAPNSTLLAWRQDSAEPVTALDNKPVVYLGEADGILKIGCSDRMCERTAENRRDFGPSFRLVRVWETSNNRAVEAVLKRELRARGALVSRTINGKVQTELCTLPVGLTAELIDRLVASHPSPYVSAAELDIQKEHTEQHRLKLQIQQEKTRQLALQVKLRELGARSSRRSNKSPVVP